MSRKFNRDVTVIHGTSNSDTLNRKDMFIGTMILMLFIIVGIIGIYILYQFFSGAFDVSYLLISLMADTGLWFIGMTILAVLNKLC